MDRVLSLWEMRECFMFGARRALNVCLSTVKPVLMEPPPYKGHLSIVDMYFVSLKAEMCVVELAV